jgi:hypothetical protein
MTYHEAFDGFQNFKSGHKASSISHGWNCPAFGDNYSHIVSITLGLVVMMTVLNEK